jgi:hypothetical protein
VQCENNATVKSRVAEMFGSKPNIEQLDTSRQAFLAAWYHALLAGIPDQDIADEILGTLSAMDQLVRMAEGVKIIHDPDPETGLAPRKKSASGDVSGEGRP